MADNGVIVRPAGSGSATWAMNSLFETLLAGEESQGLLGVSLVTQPPGVATPLHRHTREAEALYLLEGSMAYRAGEDLFDVNPGCFVYLPLGIPHAFRIMGNSPARFLLLAAPGKLMGLYDEVGVPAAERRLPDGDGLPAALEIERWNTVGASYGLQVTGPPMPEPVRTSAAPEL